MSSVSKYIGKSVYNNILKSIESGKYKNWNDMRERVYGLGPKKIQILKNNFKLPDINDIKNLTENTNTNIRKSVSNKKNTLTLYDQYRKQTCDINSETLNVDHVLEIQIFNTVIKNMNHVNPDHIEIIKSIVNSDKNLNITTSKINQMKKGPITAVLNRYQNPKLRNVTLSQIIKTQDKKENEKIWKNILSTMNLRNRLLKSEFKKHKSLNEFNTKFEKISKLLI